MKNKKMNIGQAACIIVNDFLNQIRELKSFEICDTDERIYEVLGSLPNVEANTKRRFGTVDGKPEDIQFVANFAHYIIQYHIELNNIQTIELVKVKVFKDGQRGWTSVHYPT
ncbi:MAG: hypothetical protein K2W92_02850 [Alphaproteobacteria bacterium]|nr:hypothetical protein [Alphaproteobacteria bacterium]